MDKNAHFMELITDIRQRPDLGEDTIHIWGVHVPEIRGQLDALCSILCAEEQKKAERFFRESDRHSSIAARGALRVLLSAYTEIPVRKIAFDYSGNGKPHVMDSDIEFNVSHSGEWVVLAFGRNRNVGVDVEKIKREIDVQAIASRYFTLEEIALIEKAEDRHALFFQLWARKEAYVKARGSGLFRELNRVSVPIEQGGLPERGEKDGWIFQRLEAGSKYAAAVVTDKPLTRVPCYDFGGLKWLC